MVSRGRDDCSLEVREVDLAGVCEKCLVHFKSIYGIVGMVGRSSTLLDCYLLLVPKVPSPRLGR